MIKHTLILTPDQFNALSVRMGVSISGIDVSAIQRIGIHIPNITMTANAEDFDKIVEETAALGEESDYEPDKGPEYISIDCYEENAEKSIDNLAAIGSLWKDGWR